MNTQHAVRVGQSPPYTGIGFLPKWIRRLNEHGDGVTMDADGFTLDPSKFTVEAPETELSAEGENSE